MQRQTQGGLSPAEASRLITASAPSTQVSLGDLDPTQLSLCRHLLDWLQLYQSFEYEIKHNLPVPPASDSAAVKTHFHGEEPCMLLGTAGTGKMTTLKAANQELETKGLQGRIVRAAFTGVAASNMGSGSRTTVSLCRSARVEKLTGSLTP